jgi:hypothetical protein
MAYKYKYLAVKRKSDQLVIKRDDVSHLNKKGINQQWDNLDVKFPKEKYLVWFVESEVELNVYDRSDSPE